MRITKRTQDFVYYWVSRRTAANRAATDCLWGRALAHGRSRTSAHPIRACVCSGWVRVTGDMLLMASISKKGKMEKDKNKTQHAHFVTTLLAHRMGRPGSWQAAAPKVVVVVHLGRV